jgi:hypothetical protein
LRSRSAIVTWSPSKFVTVRSSRMAVSAAIAASRVEDGEKSESYVNSGSVVSSSSTSTSTRVSTRSRRSNEALLMRCDRSTGSARSAALNWPVLASSASLSVSTL